jgi:hypothetical protein
MPAKSASTRVKAKVARKAVSAPKAEPPAKKVRMSRLEAGRLAKFKALMKKYEGKLAFAGSDE